jgi:serine/threonine protein kinase
MDELTSQFPYEIGIDFKYIETIDHGAFGTVIHVIEISTNKDMAIKVINKSNSRTSLIKKIKEEISILKKLNHENIVKFFGFFETNNQLLIKMEYVKYGTLSKWMKNNKKISEQEASIILKQIFSAIEYLHGKQICHRDIKPENIMLSKENDLNSIKIVDFGLSASNFDKLINHDYCGTYIYMAPEQIEKKLYFISVDIWSIGILMFMLLNNGKHPFYVKGESIKDFNKKIQNCKINFYNKISPMAQHLLFKLLEPNPSWRYNAAQALKHPWITRNKNDEVPLTFNEILHKSNMKKVGKELFGAMLFINYFTKKKKFLINNKYIQTCKFYDKKAENKNIRRKEKCLDILTTSEGDDSENELPNEKKNFAKIKLSEKKSDLVNSVQNSFVISANNIIHKIIKKKKMNFAQSMKNVKRLNRINHTDKKLPFNFKKMDYQLNLFSTRKRVDSLKKNNNENNNNIFRTHLIKICIKSQNEKTNEILKRNSYKSIQNENNKELNYSKSLRIINNSKKPRINNYYEERIKNKKQLPDINSQLKKNDISSKQYSLNDSENYNIIPLVLPNIKLLKRANYLRKSIKKVVIRNKGNKIKNS